MTSSWSVKVYVPDMNQYCCLACPDPIHEDLHAKCAMWFAAWQDSKAYERRSKFWRGEVEKLKGLIGDV